MYILKLVTIWSLLQAMKMKMRSYLLDCIKRILMNTIWGQKLMRFKSIKCGWSYNVMYTIFSNPRICRCLLCNHQWLKVFLGWTTNFSWMGNINRKKLKIKIEINKCYCLFSAPQCANWTSSCSIQNLMKFSSNSFRMCNTLTQQLSSKGIKP